MFGHPPTQNFQNPPTPCPIGGPLSTSLITCQTVQRKIPCRAVTPMSLHNEVTDMTEVSVKGCFPHTAHYSNLADGQANMPQNEKQK